MKTLFEGKKLYAVIIAVIFIITFLITFSIILNQYQYVLQNTINENKVTANFLSSLIHEHQMAATSILESYVQRPLFIDAVKKKDFRHIIPHLKSLSEHHTEIDVLFVSDQYGTVWANYPVSKESYGKNYVHLDWYKGVSRKWRPYISTVFRLIVLEKDLAIAVSVPILDKKGKVIGILGSIQHTVFLAAFIRANTIDPRKSITLLDQEGNMIFSTTVPYQENITKYPDARVREKALAGASIDMEIADAKDKGNIFYVSIAPVKGIGWSVIVGQEKGAILKSLYGYFIFFAVTGFAIFLFLAVALLYFRREYKYRKTKELLQAEAKFHAIADYTYDWENWFGPDGKLIWVNSAVFRFTGYSVNECFAMNGFPLQLIDEVDREKWAQHFSAAVQGESGNDVEFRIWCKDGGLKWAAISYQPIYDSKGINLGHRSSVRNITERKQGEEMLRKNELKYRNLIEQAPDIIFVVDAEGNLLHVNLAGRKMLGYSEDELCKMKSVDTYPTDEMTVGSRRLIEMRAMRAGETMHFERLMRRKDGTLFPVEINLGALEDGNTHAIIRDITERKRAEEELRESEENFRSSLDDSPLGVRIVTVEGETLYANRAILGIYGYDSIEELRRTPVKKRYTPESYAEFKIRMEKRRQGEYEPSEYEVNIVRKNGEVRHLQVFRKKILWNGEEQFQVIYQDITERKQAEEELRTSRVQLRTLATRLQQILEEERTRIAREIHDEMGGGLTGLKMDLSWLLHKVGDADPGEERVALMDKIHTSNALIDQMIHIVRRISTDLRPPVLDDLGLIAALEWQLSEFTSRTEIPHEFATPFEYVNLEEDTAVAVFRIFQEALTNVVRHSGATKVAVVLREAESGLFGDENIVLEIRDNGRGVTEEEILNSESIGLLGMKERALVFGGEFRISGELDSGTTVILKIPKKQGETP